MTDGPLKSLVIDPYWKRVAKAASNNNFTPQEVADLIQDAILSKIDISIVDRIHNTLTDSNSLFNSDQENVIAQLEALRYQCPGTIVSELIDIARDQVERGNIGLDASHTAVQILVDEVCPRYIRQIEEHWTRKGTNRSARNMRERLGSGKALIDSRALAGSMINRRNGESNLQSSRKQSGLDDGVSF